MNNIQYIEIIKKCPCCGNDLIVINNNGVKVLKCNNKKCNQVLINRLNHFCSKDSGLDIKGLSKKTLEKLVSWGWVENLKDLYDLEFMWREKWIAQPGFGEKSVDKILYNIKNSQNVPLFKFISAIGIPLIGQVQAKEICTHISSWGEFRDLIDDKFNFNDWNSFGPEKTSQLWNFDYSEADELIAKYIVTTCEKPVEKKNSSIKDKKFCITGTMEIFRNRTELKNEIEKAGGKIVSAVSSNTNYLISNTPDSNSGKTTKAKALKVPIISEKDFIKMLEEGE